MKTFMLFPFLIIFFGINNLKAQSFPLSGATWIFKSDHPFGMDEFALKFEYEEDSIIQESVIKKIKVTTKTVNPGWLPDSTTLINENQQHFLYAGDTNMEHK